MGHLEAWISHREIPTVILVARFRIPNFVLVGNHREYETEVMSHDLRQHQRTHRTHRRTPRPSGLPGLQPGSTSANPFGRVHVNIQALGLVLRWVIVVTFWQRAGCCRGGWEWFRG